MEEERHGHNLLNSSLRGFYDNPREEDTSEQRGEEAEGHGVNRSAPPAGTSGRGVNGLFGVEQGGVSKTGGKRKREEKDPLEAYRSLVGGASVEGGLEPGLGGGSSNQGAKLGAFETPGKGMAGQPDGSGPGQPIFGASENGHRPAAANPKPPPGTREHVPKGPDGNRLRRGKKFAKGKARRELKGGGGNGSDPEEGQLERDEGGASLGASQPKNVWFKDLGGIEGTLDAIRELIL
jgi:hypothetical protein